MSVTTFQGWKTLLVACVSSGLSDWPFCCSFSLTNEPLCPTWKGPVKALTYFCVVQMQVVRDEGSVLACALNATCAALTDAGVLLHSVFGEHKLHATFITMCYSHAAS